MRNNMVKKSLTIEPVDFQQIFRADELKSMRIKLDTLGPGWREMFTYDSCKMYARKRGFWIELAAFHYGYYDCCAKWKKSFQDACPHLSDEVARVGYKKAWECKDCGRIEVTDQDLRDLTTVRDCGE